MENSFLRSRVAARVFEPFGSSFSIYSRPPEIAWLEVPESPRQLCSILAT